MFDNVIMQEKKISLTSYIWILGTCSKNEQITKNIVFNLCE